MSSCLPLKPVLLVRKRKISFFKIEFNLSKRTLTLMLKQERNYKGEILLESLPFLLGRTLLRGSSPQKSLNLSIIELLNAKNVQLKYASPLTRVHLILSARSALMNLTLTQNYKSGSEEKTTLKVTSRWSL